jgi:hypothetical protein
MNPATAPVQLFARPGVSLNCPFCGADCSLPTRSDFRPAARVRYSVSCTNEDCPLEPCAWGNTPEEVLAVWNCRHVPEVSREALEAAFTVTDNQGSMREAIRAAMAVMLGKKP